MTEFLTTAKTTAAIEDVIRHADEWILLISPYLKFDENFKRRIESKRGLGRVTIIYGKTELRTSDERWLVSQSWIERRFCKTLHAKCYLNEREAVLTSMNLHKYSQENNHEMGIRVSRNEDEGIYGEILDEAREIKRDSKVMGEVPKSLQDQSTSPVHAGKKELARPSSRAVQIVESGYCIRCCKDIFPDPNKPYCPTHYRSWNRYKNRGYAEKHCHLCGKEHSTTMAKPVCRVCFKRYEGVFQFPAA